MFEMQFINKFKYLLILTHFIFIYQTLASGSSWEENETSPYQSMSKYMKKSVKFVLGRSVVMLYSSLYGE
jgi:hypothetical protein